MSFKHKNECKRKIEPLRRQKMLKLKVSLIIQTVPWNFGSLLAQKKLQLEQFEDLTPIPNLFFSEYTCIFELCSEM